MRELTIFRLIIRCKICKEENYSKAMESHRKLEIKNLKRESEIIGK